MTPGTVECVLPARARLGECPLWSAAEARLYWVDIDERRVHRFDPAAGSDEEREVPGRPGSIAFTDVVGRLLVSSENRLGFLDFVSGGWTQWVELEPAGSGNRMNDGRCDPAGRFWVGSIFVPTSARKRTGMLHRVEGDGTAATVRTGVGVSNGLAFSPDGRTMYWADTPDETVWCYDFDPATGEATNERVFLDFRPLPGVPDGAAVDEDGCYWVACVQGAAVLRVTPAGRVDRRIDLPVMDPTMPAFGGPDRSTLFVTSIGGDPGSRRPGSLDGNLFAIQTDVRGLPETAFAGGRTVAA